MCDAAKQRVGRHVRSRGGPSTDPKNVYRGTFVPGRFPEGLLEKSHGGFSLQELIALADDKPRQSSFRAEVLYWDTEGYSQGDLIRASTGWPQWLPITVAGDHGAISTLSFLRGVDLGARHYVTTNVIKDSLVHRAEWMRVKLVRSPWQDWIDRAKVAIDDAARGTIAFVPHLVPGSQHTEAFTRDYVEALHDLPDEYGPVVACLHKHDVKSGLAAALMDLGVPVISAGNTSHPLYFHRWVELVRRFRYATSSYPGSDLVLFHQLGGTYFVYGPKLEFHGSIDSDDRAASQMTDLEVLLQNELDDLRDRLFAYPPDRSARPAQDAYLSLFLTAGDRLTPWAFWRLLAGALVRVRPSYWRKWLRHLWKWAKRRADRAIRELF